MPGCTALNCRNHSNKGFKLYVFPREPERRKKWIINCRRDNWNPSIHAKLCEVHFEESQFENHRADGKRKLRPFAVPTLFKVPNSPPQETLSRKPPRKRLFSQLENDQNEVVTMEHGYSKRKHVAARSGSPGTLLCENNEERNCAHQEEVLPGLERNCAHQEEVILSLERNCAHQEEVIPDVEQYCAHQEEVIPDLERNCTDEEEVIPDLEGNYSHQEEVIPSVEKYRALQNKVWKLQKQLQQVKREHALFTSKVFQLGFFNGDQIEVMKKKCNNRGRKWSTESLVRGLHTRFVIGVTGYNFLRSQGYPLPSYRTLCEHVRGLELKPGTCACTCTKHTNFKQQKEKVTTVMPQEKDCVMPLDEMQTKEIMDYVSTDSFVESVTMPATVRNDEAPPLDKAK